VLHFAIIQRTKSTPHDYKICTPWIWTFYETVYIGLFTSSSPLKWGMKLYMAIQSKGLS